MVLLLKKWQETGGVTVNAFIDGKEVEDPFGAGHLQMSTYNTASNR
ncbi:hypothetical protein NXW76_26390 [Bacteroides thetaiotaomicron]|nr:hypothetical protein [Bacteroides thetaiotaomicron]